MAGTNRTRREVVAGVGTVLGGAGLARATGATGLTGTNHAEVQFDDQSTTGQVSVERARLPDGGFVAIRRGAATGPIVGVSEPVVTSTLQYNIRITLEESLSEPTEFVAVLHRDTDRNREFDFRDTDGEEDGPYVDDGEPVADAATVSPPATGTAEPTPTPEPTPRVTPTDTATATAADETPWSGASTPILGVGAAALFLGGAIAGAVGWRRFGGDGSEPAAADRAPVDEDRNGSDGRDRTATGGNGRDARTAGETAARTAGEADARTAGEAAAQAGTDDEGAREGVGGPTAWGRKREQGGAPAYPVGGHAPPREVPGSPDLTVEYDDLRIEELLRRDERGDVYRATVGDDEVVVREPRYEGQLGDAAVERFVQGVEAWSALDDHDNVVGLVGWGTEPTPWLAMESMDAGDLADRTDGLPLTQATWIAASVADAVWHAHQQDVLHLDLRPSNVLFRWAGEDVWAVPKVSDWGAGRSVLDQTRAVAGPSPAYAAPEQIDQNRYGTPNHATDVYQVGAVCYELFTGQPPFAGRVPDVLFGVLEDDPAPPTSLAGGLPYELDEILLGALAKRRANRYESMAYLREDLWDLYDSVRGRR